MNPRRVLGRFGVRRRSAGERIVTAIGKGLVSGLVGTAAITLSQMIEMKLSKRAPSSAPADAAGKVLGVRPRGPKERERFSNTVHWGYGIAWGLARATLGGARRNR